MNDTIKKESLKFTDSTVFEGMPSISAVIKAIRTGKSDRKIHRILCFFTFFFNDIYAFFNWRKMEKRQRLE